MWISPPYGSPLAPEFLDNASSPNDASLVTVSAGATTEVTDARLDVGGTMSGRVIDGDGKPVAGVAVWATLSAEGSGGSLNVSGTTDPEGRYVLAGLATGDYVVGFYPSPDSGLKPEFFRNRINAEEAVPVSVTAGAETTNSDAVLSPDGPVALPGAPVDVVAAARRRAGDDYLGRSSDGWSGSALHGDRHPRRAKLRDQHVVMHDRRPREWHRVHLLGRREQRRRIRSDVPNLDGGHSSWGSVGTTGARCGDGAGCEPWSGRSSADVAAANQRRGLRASRLCRTAIQRRHH